MMIKIISVISKNWEYLKGSVDKFSLQSRIYHSVCIATMLVIAYNIPFSIIVGLYKMAGLSFSLLLLQFYFYYLSRFRSKLNVSMVMYAVIINIFFALDFYFSSGIQGATLYSFTIAYFLIIAIARKKHYWYWTIGNLVLVLGLIFYEYHHPQTVHYRYSSKANQYIDIASTYTINIILIFSCLTYIINNYKLEKRLAEERERKMRSLSEEKTKLISIISHDFRTPLRNIQAYLEILQKTDLSKEERDGIQSELATQTAETQRLLKNLLAWTRGQMDSSPLVLDRLDLGATLQELQSEALRAASAKGVNFISEIPDGIFVLVNVVMLETIVRNLINNAIKFTPKGGSVRIYVKENEGGLELIVSDTGIGITKSQQANVFSLNINPTYGTDNERGIGLGLALCKELAIAQKMDISFESKKGNGTRFCLKLNQ